MIEILNIVDSEKFNRLLDLYKGHKDTLGFFPLGAFEERRDSHEILIAVSNGQVLGYLLFRTTKTEVIIVHLCIDEQQRKKGISRLLINHLIENTKQYHGIGLHCRRNYEASKIWPSLGFIAQGDKPGRSFEGYLLTFWWIEHKHPDLFSYYPIQEENKIPIIIDSNVFFDLFEKSSIDTDDSKALLADWLKDNIQIYVTPELKNEINRNENDEERKNSHAHFNKFSCVDNKPQEVEKVYHELLKFYPYIKKRSDKSDLRQLSHAIVNEIEYFITKDQKLLSQGDEFFRRYQINLLHPVEFISNIDKHIRAVDYQPSRVKSSQLKREILTADQVGVIISNFHDAKSKEQKSFFERTISNAIANPSQYECVIFRDKSDAIKALLIIDRGEKEVLSVPIIRISNSKYSSTLSRFLIHELVALSIKEKRLFSVIKEKFINSQIENALIDSCFLKHKEEWVKISIKMVASSGYVSKRLKTYTDNRLLYNDFVDKIIELINHAVKSTEQSKYIQLERLLFPVKFSDLEIPGVIIPIKPYWAENLFDYVLASDNMFGAKESAMLDFENIYYRAGRGINAKVPSRILWYVSSDKKYENSKQLRACSYLDDVIIDFPKTLYKHYNRLGIYEWNDVYETAKKDINNKIMAIKFSYTEVFDNPIEWESLQELLLKIKGKTNQIQSPLNISHDIFIQIYTMGF